LVEDNEHIIKFTGSGYDPYMMGDTVKIDDEISLPQKQLVYAPNQVLLIFFCI